MRSVELFAGAGGLALGISQAGFKHEAVVEWDHDACDTIRANQDLKLEHVREWTLREGDVKTFDYSGIQPDIDLLAAGVPCQPWSIGGKHRGYEDERNLFPDTIRAVVALRPKAILIENVKGLTRQSFVNYFTYINLMLAFPEVIREDGEQWCHHLGRLEQRETSGNQDGLRYNVVHELLNAANYDVPQKRERMFIVAFRSDLGIKWNFPEHTHSQELLWESPCHRPLLARAQDRQEKPPAERQRQARRQVPRAQHLHRGPGTLADRARRGPHPTPARVRERAEPHAATRRASYTGYTGRRSRRPGETDGETLDYGGLKPNIDLRRANQKLVVYRR